MSETTIMPDLFYTATHEWVKVENQKITIGLTDFAQQELSDIVYLEYHAAEGDIVKKGDSLCTVEAVKTAEDIFSPVDGKILKINVALPDNPSLLNKEPYEGGWIAVIETSEEFSPAYLLSAEDYKMVVLESAH
ncbi:glycine cleavage system protein GcvH [candidate division WOR-3 bacterium]|nr:glycine cleavage system protein GcvH [candidate division WOR-3 bacterium]